MAAKKRGLASLVGKNVTLFCVNYIYTGKLKGVVDGAAELTDAGIVYETGDFKEKSWKDMQKLCDGPVYVQLSAVESYMILKS